MRIIGGTYKGRQIQVDKGLPVRPTTSFATEALFNILNNRYDFESIRVLDLFSGTGHLSFELASRGCNHITSVDSNNKCVQFQKRISNQFEWPISIIKGDVFKFLSEAPLNRYDVIIADPPYDMNNIPDIHRLVYEKYWLNPGGLLIIEHGPRTKLDNLEYFAEHRKYGNVNFSFFESPAH